MAADRERTVVDRSDVIGAIAQFVASRSGEPCDLIHEQFDFVSAGLMDSLSLIELLFFVQDTFAGGIRLGDISLDQLRTPARVYDLLASSPRTE
jgi:acyl carrier protein